MARWEPNPRERLERAAMELFALQGFEATTVDEIAESAGMARSGFFRHYRDKRDVFSGGHDGLAVLFTEGMRSVSSEASPGEAVAAGFDAIAAVFFTDERRDLAPTRFAVIASSTDLQERDLLKRQHLTDSVTAALIARGQDEVQASVVANLTALAFARALPVWGETTNTEQFSVIARHLLDEISAAARHCLDRPRPAASGE